MRAGWLTPARARRVRLLVARNRHRLIVLSCAVAAACVVQALAGGPGRTVPVWTAARDLPAGRVLTPDDLTRTRWPAELAAGWAGDAIPTGILAAPLRRGEPVTGLRVLGPGLLTGQLPGTVAVTVRLAAPSMTLGVRTGSRVDVLAVEADPMGGDPMAGDALGSSDPAASGVPQARVVAREALVLGTPGSPALGDDGLDPATSDAAVLVLAVDRATAARLAAAQVRAALSVALTDLTDRA